MSKHTSAKRNAPKKPHKAAAKSPAKKVPHVVYPPDPSVTPPEPTSGS